MYVVANAMHAYSFYYLYTIYAYGMIHTIRVCMVATVEAMVYSYTICVWLYLMRIRVWYVPYAYGIKYAYGTEH